ncbi:MAG: glycosyltransferase family 2 protein [Planctomycetes bacterium]|nr:glycosyltransferase family 2 protein [Planctomycetota bacterium]
MNIPLVSIIIPCYNYGCYLSEAIESALNQTYKPIEIIVISDGSTDNTIEVAQKYPVRLINQVHKGAGTTFNNGVLASTGEYCVILNADDKIHPSYVEKTLSVLLKHNVTFVYTYMTLFGTINGLVKHDEYNLKHLKLGQSINGSGLIKKSAYLESGGCDPSIAVIEEWNLWLAFAEKKYYGKLLPEPLLFFRVHKQKPRTKLRGKVLITARQILQKHRSLYNPLELFLVDKLFVIRHYIDRRLFPPCSRRRTIYKGLTEYVKNMIINRV